MSSTDQNPKRQTELFRGREHDHVYVDHASGASTNHPKLREVLKVLRRDDTLVVKIPDRLARNTVDLLNIAHELQDKGVSLEFLDTPALNVDSASGEFMLTIYAGFATLERALIRERQAEGIAIAKAKGKYEREPKLTPGQVEEARRRIEAGVPKAKVARDLGVSRTTIYRALAGDGIYRHQ